MPSIYRTTVRTVNNFVDLSKLNVEGLRKLYEEDQIARYILDYCRQRKRNRSYTTVQTIQMNLWKNHRLIVKNREIVAVLKKLEVLGCGEFRPGRHLFKSRFEWSIPIIYVGMAAAGELQLSNTQQTEVNALPEGKGKFIRHTFILRPGVAVSMDLPVDLTSAESERLARFVTSLPFANMRSA